MKKGQEDTEESLDPEAQKAKKLQDIFNQIKYSDNYEDELYVYRHITLPKPLMKIIPQEFWSPGTGALKILTEEECRCIGIQQSHGWEHYEVHAPEPQILLFRRPLDSYPETREKVKTRSTTRKA